MARKIRIDDLYPVESTDVLSVCPLCGRDMEQEDEDRHHLVPRQKGGEKGATAMIHRFCHTKIHATLRNNELAKSFNTIEALQAHPEIAKFIEWVQGKPSSFYMKNDQAGRRKGKT